MSWFRKSPGKQEKIKQREELVKTALSSQQALEKAASSTMDMAADVTTTLQKKIDEYAAQIESTARLLTDALLLVDASGEIHSFNPAAEKIFGWKKNEIVGDSLTKLFKFNSGVVVNAAFMEGFCNQVNDESLTTDSVQHETFQGIQKDGSEIYVDVSASRLIRNGQTTMFLILVRNVTHKVRNDQMIKALALRNEELITAVNLSDTGMIILEPNGKEYTTAFVNKGFESMTGYTRLQLLKKRILDLFDEDDGSRFTVRRCLMEQTTCRHEVRVTRKNKELLHCDVSITPVFKDRKLKQWIVVFYDTSELKQAYDELQKSEQHFRAFAETSSEVLVIHNGERMIDWNSRLVAMCGYSDEEISKLHPLDLVHPLERTGVRATIGENGIAAYETLNVTKSGDVLWVAVNSQPIDWNGVPARIAVMRDITPYREVQSELKTLRERYRSVVDNTIDLVCCFDHNFRITFANQTFRDYYDYEREDLTGHNLLELIPEEDHLKFIDYMHSITPDTDVRRGVHRVKRTGEMRWQDWIDRGIFNEDGDLIEYQSVSRDITHLMGPNKTA